MAYPFQAKLFQIIRTKGRARQDNAVVRASHYTNRHAKSQSPIVPPKTWFKI